MWAAVWRRDFPPIVFSASDVIALTAVIVGPLVGYRGAVLAYRSAAEGRQAQAEAARTARMHDDRAAAYLDLVQQLYRTTDYINRVGGLFVEGGTVLPTFLDDDAGRRLISQVGLVGSQQVRGKVTEFNRLAHEWRADWGLIESYRKHHPGIDPAPERGPEDPPEDPKAALQRDPEYRARMAAEDLRTRINAARDEIVDLANAELAT